MVFKKMLSAFGVGGPSVDTVLANPNTRPGLMLNGQVNLRGGEVAADIDEITLSLVTRVEMESGDHEFVGNMEFHRLPVAGRMRLEPKQQLAIPFQMPIPWETPITDVYGQRLHGMTMGVRTEVAIARAVDKGDLDPIAVHPLPVQEKILEAFGRLGFRFKSADLERGQLYGVQQTLPFFQEIEYFAPPQYAHVIREVELTFVANPHTVDVILEADKRGGFFSSGHDTYGRHVVHHASVDQVDWLSQVEGWINQLVGHYGSMGHGYAQPGYPQPGYPQPGYPQPGYPAQAAYGAPGHYPPAGHYAGHGHHRGGSGMGAVVGGAAAGAALGFVGGMVAGELIEGAAEEAFEAFGDDGGDFDFGGE